MALNGIDIASHQKTLIPSQVDADFIIIKSTQNTSYTNPYFKTHYEQAKQAGKLLGVYHYVGGGGAAAQAKYFVDSLKSVGAIGQAIIAIDQESNQNAKWGDAKYVKTLMDEIYKLTGVKPFLYTSHGYCAVYNNCSEYPLWGAQYKNYNVTYYQSAPWEDGKVWGNWGARPTIRQYQGEGGRIKGYSGPVDLNLFYGTKEDWKNYAAVKGKANTAPTTTTTKETTNTMAVKATTDFIKYAGKISNSGGDENWGIHGGQAGDQTGHEWEIRNFYNRPWDCVLRHPDQQVRDLIAELAIEAANNNKIGYDQYQRDTYWNQLAKSGYRPSKITTACQADCSAGVIANTRAVGYLLGRNELKNIGATYTGNMRAAYKAAGFQVLTDSKYHTVQDYLMPGDILLADAHHAATNLGIGSKSGYKANGAVMTTAGKTIDQLAQEVLDNKWGTGDYRKLALGDKYDAVQARVNEILKGNTTQTQTPTTPKKTVEELAQEVLENKWGTGDARKQALTKAGYDYNAVQAKVNEILKNKNTTTPATQPKTIPVYNGKYSQTVVRSGKITANILNIRTQPTIKSNKLISYPTLSKNTTVGICMQTKDEDGDTWYYIRITGAKGVKFGFASAAYIDLV